MAEAVHPLDLLMALSARVHQAAAPLPRERSDTDAWRGLGFQLAGVRFVVAIGEAQEVLSLPRITRLPGVQPFVLGVANVRGRLLPIINLHTLLGLEPTLPRAQWRVLVVEDGDLLCGLVVEQSHGMQEFPGDGFTDDRPREIAGVLPFVKGAYRQSGRPWYLFSLRRLVRDPRFHAVAG